MIETRVIDGADVYGVPQNEYVLDGKAGHDYTDALAAAAFRQSTAVEADLTAMGAVVRARQTKLNELDVAMSTIAYAIGTMPDPNHGDSGDLSDKIDALMDARDVARKYGITGVTSPAARIVTAAAFTSNLFAAAPVIYDRETLAKCGQSQAVIINSGAKLTIYNRLTIAQKDEPQTVKE